MYMSTHFVLVVHKHQDSTLVVKHLHPLSNHQQVYKLVLLDLPGLLFFSTYTLLVLFWAEIYHQVALPVSATLFILPFSIK